MWKRHEEAFQLWFNCLEKANGRESLQLKHHFIHNSKQTANLILRYSTRFRFTLSTYTPISNEPLSFDSHFIPSQQNPGFKIHSAWLIGPILFPFHCLKIRASFFFCPTQQIKNFVIYIMSIFKRGSSSVTTEKWPTFIFYRPHQNLHPSW